MEKDLWFSINQENEFLGVIKVIIRLVIFFWFYHSGHKTAKKVFSAIEGIEYLKATVWILSLWSIRIQFYFFQIWKKTLGQNIILPILWTIWLGPHDGSENRDHNYWKYFRNRWNWSGTTFNPPEKHNFLPHTDQKYGPKIMRPIWD